MGVLDQLLAGLAGGSRAYEHQQDTAAKEKIAAELHQAQMANLQSEMQNRQEQRYTQGFRSGTAPDAKGILAGLNLGASVADASGAPGVSVASQVGNAQAQQAKPEQYAPDRYQQVNPSAYVDNTATPEAQANRRQQSAAVIAMQQAMANADRSDARAATTADRLDARSAARTAAMAAKMDPRAVHAANRDYDVAHPLPMQSVPRQPTEVQSRAKLVYPRAQSAAADLEPFFTSGAPIRSQASRVPVLGNYALSPDEQKMNQAAETIASSILRLESGANYTKNEVESYKKQFLPAPGDSPEVLKQKRATLLEQLDAMKELADRSPASPITVPRGSVQPQQGHAAPGNVNLGDTVGHTMPAKPPLAERVQQLKAKGMDKATAKATLRAEGYQVPE